MSWRACFADLNILAQDRDTNNDILRFLGDYGYECVAINHEVKLAKKIQIKPAPDLQLLLDTPTVPKGSRQRAVQVLQRITVAVEDPSVLHALASPQLGSYDLLAICPGTDKVLQQACSVLNVDIISMKLDERLPFRLKHAQIGQAVERGIYFEICYTPALKDATARRNVLANAMELVNVSRGKNIIVSSQAMKGLDTRGPADVINLCHLFGLTGEMCKSSVTSHCRSVLLHSAVPQVVNLIVPGSEMQAMRRKTVKGVVACEVVGEEQLCVGTTDETDMSITQSPGKTTESPTQAVASSNKKSRKRKKQVEGGNKPKRTKQD